MNINDLEGVELDLAVARAEGYLANFSFAHPTGHAPDADWRERHDYKPSTEWITGGPIIERERITLTWAQMPPSSPLAWLADHPAHPNFGHYKRSSSFGGPTPLIAAMRAFVASRLPPSSVSPLG